MTSSSLGEEGHRSLQAPGHWGGAREESSASWALRPTVHLLWRGTSQGWDNQEDVHKDTGENGTPACPHRLRHFTNTAGKEGLGYRWTSPARIRPEAEREYPSQSSSKRASLASSPGPPGPIPGSCQAGSGPQQRHPKPQPPMGRQEGSGTHIGVTNLLQPTVGHRSFQGLGTGSLGPLPF